VVSAGRNDALRGIACIAFAVSSFALTDAMVKALAHWHPMQIIFVRTMFAAVMIAWLIRRDGGFATLRVRSPRLHVLRGLVSIVTMLAFTYAFQTLPLAEVQACGFAAPLVITLLAVPRLGERIGGRRLTAVVVGFAGVLLIVEPGSISLQPAILVPLFGAFTFGLGMVLARKLSMTDSNAAILFTVNATAFLASVGFLPFVWQTPESARDVLLMVAFGVINTVGQFFQLQAYRLAPAGVVGPFQYVSILWGLALGWFLWGEWPTAGDLLGAAVVVASGLYILWRETVRARSVRPVAGTTAVDRSAP
jgi:drug/metabolite transporter (DMT)-like permease